MIYDYNHYNDPKKRNNVRQRLSGERKRKEGKSYVYSNNTTRKNDGLQGFKAGRN